MEWLRSFTIRILRGYPTIDEAIEAIRDKKLDEKYTILTLAVKKLFNTIGADDILRIHPETGRWLFKGRELSEGERKLIVAEAVQLTQMRLWQILQDDISYQANRKMFLVSRSDEDIVAGKLWLFTLDAMRTRLKSLVKASGAFNAEELK